MAKLTFLLDGNVVKEHVLNKERVTIGRRASNDVHIDNLAISGQHAIVVTTTDGTYIEDLNSTNGTIVNKVKIKKHMLADGDLVRLGKYKLRYVQDETIHKPLQDGFESTVVVEDRPRDTFHKESAPALNEEVVAQGGIAKDLATPDVGGHQDKQPRLEILNGKDAGSILLLDKAIMKIGRPNEQLALVTKRSQGYFLSHVIGKDFPLVNGTPIGSHANALNNHDEIEVLGVKMAFHLD